MFCRNCGQKLEANAKFCNSCGASIDNKNNIVVNIPNNNVVAQNNQKKEGASGLAITAYILAAIIVMIHLVLLISGLTIISDNDSDVFGSLFILAPISLPIFYITGLVLSIVDKVKHKKSVHGIILLVIYIILGIILIIETIIVISMIAACIQGLNNCTIG